MSRSIASTIPSPTRRSDIGWTVLRLMVAVIVGAHGWTRLLNWEFADFGQWLTSQGVPFGVGVAATITLLEAAGSVLLALRLLVLPVALSLSAVYAVGIVMVHAPDGWFVVGKGRNGAEFSVLLIVSLLCVALQHTPSRWLTGDSPPPAPPRGSDSSRP